MNPITSDAHRSARYEALFTAVVWGLTCLYTVGYAALFAYRVEPEPPLLLGMPLWVFWGVMAPWTVCTLLTIGFALWGMKDETLGADAPLPEDESAHA
jgi:hypothetical protein